MLHYISGHTFHLLSIGGESSVFMTYYPHLNCLAMPSTENPPDLPPLLLFYVLTLFFIYTYSIYSLKIFEDGKL